MIQNEVGFLDDHTNVGLKVFFQLQIVEIVFVSQNIVQVIFVLFDKVIVKFKSLVVFVHHLSVHESSLIINKK